MALYKRQDSNIWQMCFFLNGKKVRLSTKTSNKKVAQRIYEKAKVEAVEGTFLINEKGKMPFSRLVHEFIEKHSKVEKERPEQDKNLGNQLTRYFKNQPIGKITPYDIKSWRQWRKEHITRRGTKISKASLNRELAFLKTMFNLAVEWGWLRENPAAKIKTLKGENKRMRFLTRKEVFRLIDCAAPLLKPLIIVAVSTGMRQGEILNLRWKDVDFKHGFIRVVKSKNHEPRDIPMSRFLAGTFLNLSKSRAIGNFVFCTQNGEKRTHPQRAFREACEKAGLEDFRFHDLRHTAASLYASFGCDLIMLKDLLGHNSVLMTQRYAHLMPDQHNRTRQIMEGFWTSPGDTDSDTPDFPESKKLPEIFDNQPFWDN